jgi:hypothetical protein
MAEDVKKVDKELSAQGLRDYLAKHRDAAIYVNGTRLKESYIKVVKDPSKYEVHITANAESGVKK